MADVLYKIGDKVAMTANYLCVPCRYVQFFHSSDVFTTCEAGYAGTDLGPENYREIGSQFWQLVG